MSKWDGKYDTSREGKQSLEEDIMDAGCGKFTYPDKYGNKVQETDHSINIYGPSNSDKGHFHRGYNHDTGKTYGHD